MLRLELLKGFIIDPGVRFVFYASDDQDGGQDQQIKRNLTAIGTVSDSIIFTSNRSTPIAGAIQAYEVII